MKPVIGMKMDQVERWILANVDAHPHDIARLAMEQFRLSRPAVLRRLHRLVSSGILSASGNTRARRYGLANLVDWPVFAPNSPQYAEDLIWREDIAPRLADVPPNVLEICNYGFTEIYNNALSHSGSPLIFSHLTRTATKITLEVKDTGMGIFQKIQTECGLHDLHQAVLELSKGKLTTDPSSHSGEGIFFTSRMFDSFSILSGGLFFAHRFDEDWLLDAAPTGSVTGTLVTMEIGAAVTRTAQEIMDQFAVPDDRSFSRTHIIVGLLRHGVEQLNSRSQAKRLLARLTAFREVIMDFSGVDKIGQGFADEVFRVFQENHPQVGIQVVNASQSIRWMIDHVKRGGATTDSTTGYLPGLVPGGGGGHRAIAAEEEALMVY